MWKNEVAKNTKGHIWHKITPQKLEYGESYQIFNSMIIWSKLSKHVVLVTKLIHLIPYSTSVQTLVCSNLFGLFRPISTCFAKYTYFGHVLFILNFLSFFFYFLFFFSNLYIFTYYLYESAFVSSLLFFSLLQKMYFSHGQINWK